MTPEIDGEKFANGSDFWAKISGEKRILFLNEVWKLIEYQPDGMSRSGPKRIIIKNPKGAVMAYRVLSDRQFKLSVRAKFTVAYIAYSLIAKNKNIVRDASSKFLCVLLFPVGWMAKITLLKLYGDGK
jgi:hypothetical protein